MNRNTTRGEEIYTVLFDIVGDIGSPRVSFLIPVTGRISSTKLVMTSWLATVQGILHPQLETRRCTLGIPTAGLMRSS